MDSKIFGVSLEDLSKGQQNFVDGIPVPVFYSVEYLLTDNRGKEEGLFRREGSSADIENLRKMYDSGYRGKIPPNTDIHAVSNLIKLFLRSMPQPLVPAHLYQPLCDTAVKVDTLPKQEIVSTISDMLQSIPETNKRFLIYLCNFLNKIGVEWKEKTLMGIDNLALIFARNLIRPEKQIPTLNFTEVTTIMEVLMESHEVIFTKKTWKEEILETIGVDTMEESTASLGKESRTLQMVEVLRRTIKDVDPRRSGAQFAEQIQAQDDEDNTRDEHGCPGRRHIHRGRRSSERRREREVLRNVKVDYNMGETLEAEDEESTPVKEARMWERPNDKSGDSSVEDDQVGSFKQKNKRRASLPSFLGNGRSNVCSAHSFECTYYGSELTRIDDTKKVLDYFGDRINPQARHNSAFALCFFHYQELLMSTDDESPTNLIQREHEEAEKRQHLRRQTEGQLITQVAGKVRQRDHSPMSKSKKHAHSRSPVKSHKTISGISTTPSAPSLNTSGIVHKSGLSAGSSPRIPKEKEYEDSQDSVETDDGKSSTRSKKKRSMSTRTRDDIKKDDKGNRDIKGRVSVDDDQVEREGRDRGRELKKKSSSRRKVNDISSANTPPSTPTSTTPSLGIAVSDIRTASPSRDWLKSTSPFSIALGISYIHPVVHHHSGSAREVGVSPRLALSSDRKKPTDDTQG